jgi:tRNA(fMet)-specific endonuclease VapC
VKPALVDTDILSLFFRGDPNVAACFDVYVAEHGRVNISIITYYEIVSGLKHRDTQKQLASFLEFVSQSNLVLLDEKSVTLSAEIYADLRAEGTPLDDSDLLIAGAALANGWVLVTHNTKHFDRIDGLEVEDWSQRKQGM